MDRQPFWIWKRRCTKSLLICFFRFILIQPYNHTRAGFQGFCTWCCTKLLPVHACSDVLPNRSLLALLSQSNLNCSPSIPGLWVFPSCSRKSDLFGLVVADFLEAWQSVSTISRSKLRQHKHHPNTTKTIWTRREWFWDLPIFFLSKTAQVLPVILWKHASMCAFLGTIWPCFLRQLCSACSLFCKKSSMAVIQVLYQVFDWKVNLCALETKAVPSPTAHRTPLPSLCPEKLGCTPPNWS